MTTTTVSPVLSDIETTCDRCPSLAQRRFVLPSGLDLVLCGHHSHENWLDLAARGAASCPIHEDLPR